MDIKIITDPVDIIYPFDETILDNPVIVYHGTCSGFSRMIEETGWQINSPPYDVQDIKFVCDCYDILNIQNNIYGILKAYPLGISNGKTNFPRFTRNFWIARGFSIHKCGEAISYLIKGIEELTLKRKLPKIKKETLRKLEVKYRKIVKNTFGVVYVIDVKPSWFSNWDSIDPIEPNTDLALIENLAPERIIAKVEFHCESIPFRPDYGLPLPLLRNMDSFKENLINSKYYDKYDDLIIQRYSENRR